MGGSFKRMTPKFVISDSELEGLLGRYTHDITAQERAGRFDPITGRDEEIDQMTLILLQRLRKNIMLLGGAGVGKTALFIGLAQWIAQDRVPEMLKGARIIELEMAMIGAGSQNRADLEGRLIPIMKGVCERNATRLYPPTIFCIDEIHQLMISFKGSSYAGIADLMKPYLTTGDMYVIGATTREEYLDYVVIEPAIDRRFQKMLLTEPDVPMTIRILENLKGNFEKHYKVEITSDTVVRLCMLVDRYIRNRNNPDKSLLTMDHACARYVKAGGKDKLDDLSVDEAVAAEAGIDPAAVK